MGSSDERDYFRRIGVAKAVSHAAATREHLALSIDERLQRSVEFYQRHRATTPPRYDDPRPFYDRARALGLYQP